MKKIIITIAIMMMAVGAMAQTTGQIDSQTFGVAVNIEVAPEVSMWAGHENVSLLMDGADANNSATFESSLAHINNVAGNISVTVDGTLPTPIVPGGGINFFIFTSGDAVSAVSAITANAYKPAGALVWKYDTMGDTQAFGSVPVSTSISSLPIVYASAAPGEIPLPDTFNLTATWTIAPTP